MNDPREMPPDADGPGPQPPRQIPRGPGAEDPGARWVDRRRALAEEAAGRALPYLAGAPVPHAEARGNVENLAGWAQVP
ncbi:MAG: hypothetical protein VX460_12540, partial [Planctomycetota bacterium]|nr:hypothetical protein [Planctomycetota bacterium]